VSRGNTTELYDPNSPTFQDEILSVYGAQRSWSHLPVHGVS
jgi:hypothetical protein